MPALDLGGAVEAAPVSVLAAKLLDLAAKDVAVEASLKSAGAIPTAASCADIGKTVGGKLVEAPPVDVAEVDRALISRAKAHIHAELEIPKPFVHEGITITITALSLDGDVLQVDLETDIGPQYEDGPYRFVNPPLQKVTREAVYDEKAEGLPVILEPRVTEDAPDEVLQTIVGQAVHGVAAARGWKP